MCDLEFLLSYDEYHDTNQRLLYTVVVYMYSEIAHINCGAAAPYPLPCNTPPYTSSRRPLVSTPSYLVRFSVQILGIVPSTIHDPR